MLWRNRRMRWLPEEALAAYADDNLTHNICVHDRLCCVVRLSQMGLSM